MSLDRSQPCIDKSELIIKKSKPSYRFKKGHIPWNKGKKDIYSKEAKEKMSKSHIGMKMGPCSDERKHKISKANKGNKSRLGQKHSEETKKRIGAANAVALKGNIVSPETRKKMSESMKGKNTYKRSDETRKRMSNARKGMKLSEEHKRNVGKASKGHILSEEAKQKISISHMGEKNGMYNIGNKHPNWQGGASFEPYCPKFNNRFKEQIRDQFNRTCFLCGISESEQINNQKIEGKRAFKLSVHHVSYKKSCLCDDKACEFVPLCTSCHTKTNFNRDHWNKTIMDKLKNEEYI